MIKSSGLNSSLLNSPTHKGIILGIIATIIFAIQDAITQHLARSIPVSIIVAVRYSAFLLFALWFVLRNHSLRQVITVSNKGLQILRGAILVIEMSVFAIALQYIGVGEMHAVFSGYPLIVAALSPWLLKERVSWQMWIAVSVGFIGTLIILNPDSQGIHAGFLLAFCCTLMFGVYTVLTRLVSKTDSFQSSMFYTAFVGFVFGIPFALLSIQPIAVDMLGWLLIISILGITSHILLIKALELVAAVTLQPFNYLTLIWALLISFVVFNEVPTLRIIFGALLIVGGGLYVVLHQNSKKKVVELTDIH